MTALRVWVFTSLVCVLALAGGTAFAKTPDGKTPAEETVCDSEQGAAKGLCNAYCEAMDCDDPNTRASEAGCAAVKANYERKTGKPFLPCEVGCPCIETLELFQRIASGTAPVTRCIADETALYIVLSSGEYAMIADGLPGFCAENGLPPFVPITPSETLACRVTLRRIIEATGVTCQRPE